MYFRNKFNTFTAINIFRQDENNLFKSIGQILSVFMTGLLKTIRIVFDLETSIFVLNLNL